MNSAPTTAGPEQVVERKPPGTTTQAFMVARLDLRRRLRDKSIVLQVFLAPILLALIVGGAFAGTAGNLDATIVLADADRTATSTAIGAALTAASSGGADDGGVVFEVMAVGDAEAAATLVREGAADAAVVLPPGYTAAVAAGDPAELVVVGSAGSPIVTGVARSVADSINIRLQSQYVSTQTAIGTAEELNLPIDPAALGAALGAPDLVVVSDSRVENTFNIMSFFAPGMAMIFLFFVMGTTARSVLTERREGTLNRVLASPTSPTAVVLGKSLAVFVLGLLSMLTVYLVTTFGFGVDWGDPVGVLLVILAVVVAITGLSLIVTGLARDEEQAQALTIVGTLLLAILGGTFIYSGTGALAKAREFTPNGQALMAFIDLSAGQAAWVEVLPRIGIIVAIGIVTGAIGLVAIRRGLR